MHMENNPIVFTDEQFGSVRIRENADHSIEINAEDAARGIGITTVATSGNVVVRWDRVNKYLRSFGYSGTVGKDDYIPENMFYLLAMKANNKAANRFKEWIANIVISSIRRNGCYATPRAVDNPDFPPKLSARLATVKIGEAIVYILTSGDLIPTLPSYVDDNNDFGLRR